MAVNDNERYPPLPWWRRLLCGALGAPLLTAGLYFFVVAVAGIVNEDPAPKKTLWLFMGATMAFAGLALVGEAFGPTVLRLRRRLLG